MVPDRKCVATPEVEVKIMMNMEVATATCIGKLAVRCIIGTIRDPPPIPSKPEEKPPKKLSGKLSLMFALYSRIVP